MSEYEQVYFIFDAVEPHGPHHPQLPQPCKPQALALYLPHPRSWIVQRLEGLLLSIQRATLFLPTLDAQAMYVFILIKPRAFISQWSSSTRLGDDGFAPYQPTQVDLDFRGQHQLLRPGISHQHHPSRLCSIHKVMDGDWMAMALGLGTCSYAQTGSCDPLSTAIRLLPDPSSA